MWDGTSFTKLGSGISTNSNVHAIYALDENHVYIGGIIQTGNNIVMWNG
jgi:hypothetical protein